MNRTLRAIAKAVGVPESELTSPEEEVQGVADALAKVVAGGETNCGKIEKVAESTETSSTVGSMSDELVTIEDRVEAMEQKFDALPELIGKAIAKALPEDPKPNEAEGEEEGNGDGNGEGEGTGNENGGTVTTEDLGKRLDTAIEAIAKLADDVDSLAAGSGSDLDELLSKGDEEARTEKIEKAYKDRGLDPDLAGIF